VQAVIARDHAVSVATVADPKPGRHEARVAVVSAGINAADILQARGHYPPPPGWDPERLGLEFAGIVDAVGPATTEVRVGDRVMGITAGGAQAEYVVVDAATLVPVPPEVDLVVAGGFPEAAFTALDALILQGGLVIGDRVLVTGALGGVGSVAVQIARIAGARVSALVRDHTRDAEAYALGAHEVLTLNELHDAGPFDIVLELLGAASLEHALGRLATNGRIIVIGTGSGGSLEFSLRTLMGVRGIVRGSTLRARPIHEKAHLANVVAHRLLPALAEGSLRVHVHGTWPLAQAAAAYEAFSQAGKRGKLLLTVRSA